jgi:phosphatidate cytidylyltransferase
MFTVAEMVSFRIAVWILAPLCFVGLREYFSLLDIRLQDRWGIWGAYLSIPFMIHFIQIDWYGMFIVSIPVYASLAIPFLVALGGEETEGTVFSIGAIDFGLFLLVYCTGHIAYLALFSTGMAIFVLANVAVCDLVAYLLGKRERSPRKGNMIHYITSMPATVLIAIAFTGWTEIPWGHAIILGMLIPILVAVGRYTIVYIESDLGIVRDHLVPGRGRIINSSASSLYAAPIVFHYIRYYLT